MLRNKRPGFSLRDDFIVHPSRDIVFGGELFERGKPFPWKDVGCTPRRLNLLYECRKLITLEEYEDQIERAQAKENVKALPDPAPDVIADDEEKDGLVKPKRGKKARSVSKKDASDSKKPRRKRRLSASQA